MSYDALLNFIKKVEDYVSRMPLLWHKDKWMVIHRDCSHVTLSFAWEPRHTQLKFYLIRNPCHGILFLLFLPIILAPPPRVDLPGEQIVGALARRFEAFLHVEDPLLQHLLRELHALLR